MQQAATFTRCCMSSHTMLAAHLFVDLELWGVKLVCSAESFVAGAEMEVGRGHGLGDETEVFARHLGVYIVCVVSNQPAALR